MKNKILPSRYLVYLIGLSLFLFLSSNTLFSQASLSWIEMGPSNFGGKTKALIFDNQDQSDQTIYAAGATGGIYLTYNLGQTWYKLNGPENAYKVSAMMQEANGSIYIGTGNIENGEIGTGIYKSTDGTNFTQLAATAPNFVSEDWWYINEIALDETNNRIYAATNTGLRYSSDGGTTWTLAKTGDTLELSGNGYDIEIGSNGTLLAGNAGLGYISPNGDPNQFMLLDTLPDNAGRLEFAIAPTDPDIMYVTIATPEGALNSVWRSNDGGTEWYMIAPGGTQTLNFFGIDEGVGTENNVLVVFPNNPDKVLLGGINMWEGVKLDEDGFFQWTMKSNGNQNNPASPYYFSYVGPRHCEYIFRPSNEKQMLIGTYRGVFIGLISSDLFEFQPKHKNYYTSQFSTIGLSGEKRRAIGGTVGNGTIRIDGFGNPNTAQYGYPVWYTANGFASQNSGGACELPIIDPQVAIYSQADGNFRRSEDLGTNASTTFFSSEVTSSFQDGANYMAPAVYWENFEDEQSRDSTWFVARKAYSTGDKIRIHSNNRFYPFYTTAPFVINPNDSVRIKDIVSTKYFVGSYLDAIWMTKEILYFGKEPEWFKIADKMNTGYEGVASCLGLSSDANFLWVGTEEGKLFRLSNIRNAYDYDRADVRSPFCMISVTEVPITWEDSGDPVDAKITSVSVDPSNPENVLITIDGFGKPQNVMKSSNGLAQSPTFTAIQDALPDVPALSSLIEMNNGDIAFVGTYQGLYMTENFSSANPSWFMPDDPSSFSIGKTPVTMIKQQLVKKQDVTYMIWDGTDSIPETFKGNNNFGVIYTATYGRGMFYCDQFQKPVGIIGHDNDPLSNININIFPNPVISSATVEVTLEEKGNVELTIFDITGRMIREESLGNQQKGVLKHTINSADMPNGTYFLNISSGANTSVSKFVVVK